jgi:glycerol-3-phosphate dehydrogenase
MGIDEAEIRFLGDKEWAQSADDILWRMSRPGLRVGAEAEQMIEAVLSEMRAGGLIS